MKNEIYGWNDIRGDPGKNGKEYPIMNDQYSISKNSEQSILAPFRQLAERAGVGLMNDQYSISKNSEHSILAPSLWGRAGVGLIK